MDIEGFVRRYIKDKDEKTLQNNLKEIILEYKNIDPQKADQMAQAVIGEVENTLKINDYDDEFLKELIKYHKAEVKMGEIGVGSRGKGDFFVHKKIADIVSSTHSNALINPSAQDDGGVVKKSVGSKDIYVTTAVDGIHSRLSEYPFLGGFHVTRAALRDVCVMGAEPVAVISDLHLSDDGDVGKLFDFTAGVCAVSELLNVPLVAGSTLRVGGDMVLGDRLVSAVGAIGISEYPPTARKRAEVGDIILMTEGSGGGTITTTAIYHGMFDVVNETMDINFIKSSEAIFKSGLLPYVHAMTDVTNGGLRGDAHEISKTTNLGLTFFNDKIRELINPKVLEMLEKLNIDPLGVSIDSLMIIAPANIAEKLKKVISDASVRIGEIGYITNSGIAKLIKEDKEEELTPLFRESAYTEIKKIVGDTTPDDFEVMKEKIEKSALNAIRKKDNLVNAIQRK